MNDKIKAERSGIKIPPAIQMGLREFMEFHFEARYPDASKFFYDKCTKAYAAAKLKEMKKVFQWIKTKL